MNSTNRSNPSLNMSLIKSIKVLVTVNYVNYVSLKYFHPLAHI